MVDLAESATAGEAPAGYRMTELGVLPEDWQVLPVSRAGRVITGTTPSTKVASYYGGTVPFITPAELDAGLCIPATAKTLTDEGLLRARPLPPRTVLVSCIGYIGKTAITTSLRSATNQQINAVIPNDDVDPLFLYFALSHSRPLLTDRAAITTVPILNKSNFEQVPIPLPPLPEQRAIAHVLSTVQRAREATEAVIVATRELKRSLMRHLFMYGPVPVDQVAGVRLKETEIGLVPEGWVVLSLGMVAAIERGKFTHRPRNDPAYYGGDTPFIQTGDVTASDGVVRSYSQTLSGLGLSVSRVFPEGTIVITIAANIGYTAILGFDSAFPDSLIGITPSLGVQTHFLNYYLMTQQPEMDRAAPRGTQKNINIQFLSPWLVPVPTPSDQAAIESAIRAVDQKLMAAENRYRVLNMISRAALSGLMSGRIRAQ